MSPSHHDFGLFVTFEGPEGAGKTTQMQLALENIRARNHPVITTREPGGTPLGEELRNLVMNYQQERIADEAELLLFSAARAQHVRHVILPALRRGHIVLCDRFIDSTLAYQGYARGLSLEFIHQLNEFVMCGRRPDLTIVLDVPVEAGFKRLADRYQGAQATDRFETAGDTFHHAVRQAFLDIASKEPWRVKVIDANRPLEQVARDVRQEIANALL